MKRLFYLTTVLLFPFFLLAQNPNKKTMDYKVYDIWNTIKEPKLSNDGQWLAYRIQPDKGDPTLVIYNTQTGKEQKFVCAEGLEFSNNNEWAAFKIKAPQDSVRAMKRRKVKKKDLPTDTLGLIRLATGELEKIADLKKFNFPEKWDDVLVYQLKDGVKKEDNKKDEKGAEGEKVKKEEKNKSEKNKKGGKKKKHSEKNGYLMVVHHLNTPQKDSFDFVTSYTLSKKGGQILFASTGKDSTFEQGVYKYDASKSNVMPLVNSEGEFVKLVLDETGSQAAFVANLDTTEAQIKPYELWVWHTGQDLAKPLLKSGDEFMPKDWVVSHNQVPKYSEDGLQLYFGIAPPPIVEDTTLLDDEKVQVEVWATTDKRLHTQQKVQLKSDRNKAYTAVWHSKSNIMQQLADENLPEVELQLKTKTKYLLAVNEEPYQMLFSWEGFPVRKDVYVVNVETGDRKLIVKNLKANVNQSPSGKYFYWFNRVDTTWNTYHIASGKTATLTSNNLGLFYNELHDLPQLAGEAGTMSWSENDQAVYFYDRFDIWKMDPRGKVAPKRLTNGREKQIRYRYIRLDREQRFVAEDETILLYTFHDKTKAQGYAKLNLKTGDLQEVLSGDFQYARRPTKARDSDVLFFTKENFQIFPDLILSNTSFTNQKTVTQANPQQKEYSWGTIELVEWTAHDGQRLQGLLAKPENFDPNKKYPMIVNFYERNSDRLHRHRHPSPGRSTITYSYYVNQGYVIFNPDVPYKIGYPGESAYNSVMSGVSNLIDQGFVDKEKIALQGHSWGGYQVAYLATKTNLFACIESGAPVVNMTSAYGGIRWGSGLSRMFQYENSQSRIGGTLWEYPVRYIENSPLFFLDKVETPILILHNDKDGAVPWYQGIEYFVALRRLGKPAWLLNYNDEPHWPVKRHNRVDFNRRMEQFFAHYLKGEPMPKWMQRGVPALEVGIEQGIDDE